MEPPSNMVERKTRQAHQAVDAAASKTIDTVAPVIDRVAQAAHETVDRVAQAAARTADLIAQSPQQLKQRPEELITASRVYIRERPLIAVGVAVALGYLIGRIARRD